MQVHIPYIDPMGHGFFMIFPSCFGFWIPPRSNKNQCKKPLRLGGLFLMIFYQNSNFPIQILNMCVWCTVWVSLRRVLLVCSLHSWCLVFDLRFWTICKCPPGNLTNGYPKRRHFWGEIHFPKHRVWYLFWSIPFFELLQVILGKFPA